PPRSNARPLHDALPIYLQEKPLAEQARRRIPKLTLTSPPQGDSGAVSEIARLMVDAENPIILAGRASRTPAGMQHLVELGEVLGDRKSTRLNSSHLVIS